MHGLFAFVKIPLRILPPVGWKTRIPVENGMSNPFEGLIPAGIGAFKGCKMEITTGMAPFRGCKGEIPAGMDRIKSHKIFNI